MATNTKFTIQLVFVAFATTCIYKSRGFNQKDYLILNDRLTVEVKDKALAKMRVENTMFNRTTRTFSVWLTLLKDPHPTNIPLIAQAYRFSGNDYKLFAALKIQSNFCDILAKNTFGFGAFKGKAGNFSDCPWKKNVVYHIHDFVPDPDKMPRFVPEGKYRMALNLYNGGDYFADVSWYGSIVKRKQF